MGNFRSNAQQEEDIANDEALFNACEYGDEDALAALLRDTIANVNHVDREQDGAFRSGASLGDHVRSRSQAPISSRPAPCIVSRVHYGVL